MSNEDPLAQRARPAPDELGLIVVGVGASAGGLEAIQEFFRVMPSDTNLAFVVIQHLSPDYRSMMDELLARYTRMSIHKAEEGMVVEPNCIYLIPPRKNLRIFHDRLLLEDQNLKKGLNLPIDIFFRSLAAEKGRHAIGVILSGTGSDGTLGTRAIKEAGGMVMVQDDVSAKFDGMPRSSISTGLVDYVLPPAQMSEELLNYLKHPFVGREQELEVTLSENLDALSKIMLIVREHSGIDFSYYKENTILRRLERRVSINRMATLEQYVQFLAESEKEQSILYRELLIGVTRFFRDSDAFDLLVEQVFPIIFRPEKRIVRIWSTGCSTGEEAYSLAMLCREYMDQHRFEGEVKIFATDIDRQSLESAGQGYYLDSMVADITPARLSRFFSRRENGYQVNDSLRKMVVFATHNLLRDPPFSKQDLIVCRNLFIYLKPEMQNHILSVFYHALNPEGHLLMGSSENIGELHDAFHTVDTKWKLYRQKPGSNPPLLSALPMLRSGRSPAMEPGSALRLSGGSSTRLIEHVAGLFAPPSILIDENNNVVHVFNDVNRFVHLRAGRFSQHLFNLLPQELNLIVNSLLRRLRETRTEIVYEDVPGLATNEEVRVDLEGRVIEDGRNRYVLLSFRPQERGESIDSAPRVSIPADGQIQERLTDVERELQFTKENLQAAIEELETSNEELQSSNEELIASNEELQSTNEELQSVNEELYTVNAEYQAKIEEMIRLNNDVNNLLKNIEVGALYLDRHLCIRKFTPSLTRITNLRDSDLGRPLYHLAVSDTYDQLMDDIGAVVKDLQPVEKEIITGAGKPFLMRIVPYRTEENAVDGVLVTFVDISRLKREASRANKAARRLQLAMEMGAMAWWDWDVETGEVQADAKKATMLGYSVAEFPTNVYEICALIHPDDYERAMQAMRDHLSGATPTYEVTYRIRTRDGGYRWYADRGGIVTRDVLGNPTHVAGIVIDVTTLKLFEVSIHQDHQVLQKILESSSLATLLVDITGRIVEVNLAATQLLGLSQQDLTGMNFTAADWLIDNADGTLLAPDKYPFARVMSSLEPLLNERFDVHIPGDTVPMPLVINGAPSLDREGAPAGALFAMELLRDD
ncbi:MAG: PAS domain-containing protein [Caldilinea sp.]|nr:PAS domain-containing protein [Caldilinea sp.]